MSVERKGKDIHPGAGRDIRRAGPSSYPNQTLKNPKLNILLIGKRHPPTFPSSSFFTKDGKPCRTPPVFAPSLPPSRVCSQTEESQSLIPSSGIHRLHYSVESCTHSHSFYFFPYTMILFLGTISYPDSWQMNGSLQGPRLPAVHFPRQSFAPQSRDLIRWVPITG